MRRQGPKQMQRECKTKINSSNIKWQYFLNAAFEKYLHFSARSQLIFAPKTEVMFKEQLIKISSQCVNFNKQKNDAETLTNTSNKRSGQVNYRSTAAGQKILLIAIQYGYSPLDKEKHKIRSIFSSNRAHPFGRCKFIFLHNDKCDFITVSTECSQKVPCPKNMIKFTSRKRKRR